MIPFSVKIKTPDTATLYIPNSFSPNNDKINDEFFVVGENILEFEGFIFNRWGELIYQWTDLNKGWNGITTTQKEYDQDCVYVYLIRVRNECRKTWETPRTGTITIIK